MNFLSFIHDLPLIKKINRKTLYSKLESIFKQINLQNPAAKFSINVNDNSNAHTEWYCGSDDSAKTACPQEHTTALQNLYVLLFLLYKDKPETKNFGK